MLRCSHVLLPILFLTWGCTVHEGRVHSHDKTNTRVSMVKPASDARVSLGLDHAAQEAHQAVMQDHLKAIHEIIAALTNDDFEQARDLTVTRLGFARHREAMRRQKPENFPPDYHDLAMAHHQAAEALAKAVPSQDLKQILPHLELTLHACVQCHDRYKR